MAKRTTLRKAQETRGVQGFSELQLSSFLKTSQTNSKIKTLRRQLANNREVMGLPAKRIASEKDRSYILTEKTQLGGGAQNQTSMLTSHGPSSCSKLTASPVVGVRSSKQSLARDRWRADLARDRRNLQVTLQRQQEDAAKAARVDEEPGP